MAFEIPSIRPLAATVILLAGCVAAAAHEVKEMTARARIFNDRVDMVITISTHMATVLLADPRFPEVVPTPENLPSLKARLESQARAFSKLIPGGGKALVPVSVDVVMSTSEELGFYLTYPASGATPLRFEMAVLERLEEGNVITLDVFDAARRRLASKALKRGDASIEIPVSAKSPPP